MESDVGALGVGYLRAAWWLTFLGGGWRGLMGIRGGGERNGESGWGRELRAVRRRL